MPATAPIRFGKYLLAERIAVGGTSEVYLAVDGATGAVVALKRALPPVAEDAELAPRFLDEARRAVAVQGPSFVPALDAGVAAGIPFVALEYVSGVTVRALLDRLAARGERVELELAGAILARVAAALSASGLAHGDLTARNVMVGFDGRVRVLDLGIGPARERTDADALERIAGEMGVSGSPLILAHSRPSTPRSLRDRYAQDERDEGPSRATPTASERDEVPSPATAIPGLAALLADRFADEILRDRDRLARALALARTRL